MVPAGYAASVSDHSYDDDAAMTVVRLAEELVGEGAYGGAWIDRTLAQPVLGVALVAPQANHVTSIPGSCSPNRLVDHDRPCEIQPCQAHLFL